MNCHIQYDTPTKEDTCVAFAFFNPCGYVRPLQNLVFFENKLRLAKIPYFSAEMIIGNQVPMLSNPTCVYRSNSYLFYKEELFNKLNTVIPDKYKKIIFLDADIIFNCTNWVDRISTLLDTHDILQVFEKVCYLDLKYNENHWTTASAVDYNVSGSGFGWAITRSFLSKIGGFFDKCTLGSGDSIFFHSIVNRPVMKYPVIQDFINEYREKIANFNPKWTYLSGVNIYHLSHGSKVNRKYVDRYGILTRSDFTWDSLFYKNEDGFWELKDRAMNNEFLDYFKNRNEDSICSFTNTPNKAAIGAVPPKNSQVKSSSSKGHSGSYSPPKKVSQPKNIGYLQVAKKNSQQVVRVNTPASAPVRSKATEQKVKSIPRYLTPQINIQRITNTNTTPAQAAAVKSYQQRSNIRNTVVYNRTTLAPTSRNYGSDDDYSD